MKNKRQLIFFLQFFIFSLKLQSKVFKNNLLIDVLKAPVNGGPIYNIFNLACKNYNQAVQILTRGASDLARTDTLAFLNGTSGACSSPLASSNLGLLGDPQL